MLCQPSRKLQVPLMTACVSQSSKAERARVTRLCYDVVVQVYPDYDDGEDLVCFED